MATVMANSQVKAAQKHARSLTHPLRDPKNGSTRRRKKQSEQIDPDELRRKLEAHLAEQKKKEKLRRAKAIAKEEKESAYHHVPKVAAAAFQRTATPVLMGEKEAKKSIHKLGHVALKHHVEENIRSMTGSFNLRKTIAMDQARKQRDLVGDRNQFQRTRDLEDAAKLDKERNLSKVPQRTFGADNLDVPRTALYCRPLSTSDLNWEEDLDADDPLFHNKSRAKALIQTVNNRQDWEQSDQVPVEVHRSVKERVSPFLRKTDSMWILKSKKEPKPDVLTEMSRSAPAGDIKQKKTFLGLFKR